MRYDSLGGKGRLGAAVGEWSGLVADRGPLLPC
jgi:hypothetical protein